MALSGLALERPIRVRLQTSEGLIHCELQPSGTPHGAALFVGLATGRAPFRDPHSGAIAWRPMYRDLAFFRAIPDSLVQSGCPLGNGTGSPGYRIAVEVRSNDAQRLATPGVLFLARYHAPPNRIDPVPPPPGQVIGSQFVIGLNDLSHLAGDVTVLGSCAELELVRRLARRVAAREGAVRLERVLVDGIAD